MRGPVPGRAWPACQRCSSSAAVPPLSTLARRVEVLEALQFTLFASGVPALVALSAPWRWLGLAGATRRSPTSRGLPSSSDPGSPTGWQRHVVDTPSWPEVVTYLVLDVTAFVVWRIPVVVDALAPRRWLSSGRGRTLVDVGIGLWLELVESPPFSPRLARPKRIAVAAVAMWTHLDRRLLVGLSHGSVYRSSTHVAGRDLSVSADQALTTGVCGSPRCARSSR